MEQEKNQQQQQPKPAVLAAAGEMKVPAVAPQQPKPAPPAMPVSRQWPMAVNPYTCTAPWKVNITEFVIDIMVCN